MWKSREVFGMKNSIIYLHTGTRRASYASITRLKVRPKSEIHFYISFLKDK